MLLYGILENEKLSQRTLEDTFNDFLFKTLFDLDKSETIRRSSISERLSKIDSDYFRQIYQCVYQQFHDVYPNKDKEKHHLIHVDSSMVSEASTKLLKGIDHKNRKKSVKYSMAFDGLLPCHSELFTKAKYASEDMAFGLGIYAGVYACVNALMCRSPSDETHAINPQPDVRNRRISHIQGYTQSCKARNTSSKHLCY